MDLEQSQQFLNNCKIRGGSGKIVKLCHFKIKDHSLSSGSDIIVITAGVRQQPGESRLNLVQRNTDIYKGIFIHGLVENYSSIQNLT